MLGSSQRLAHPLAGWPVEELRTHIERIGAEGEDLLFASREGTPYQPRSSGEAACNVARAMGHSRSTLVDAVYAHSLASGMAGVAERDAGRVFDVKPQLRVLESAASPDVRQPLEENTIAAAKAG